MRKEHFQIAQLLNILEREFNKLSRGNDPDYELINLLVEYLGTYPDAVHHRKEDLVFQKLKTKLPADAKPLFDLTAEHEKIDHLVKDLSVVLARIELDFELPKATVCQAISEYIDFMRRHMSQEETSFLPLAETQLDPEDWADINSSLTQATHPMVDQKMADRGADLYRQIIDYD